jgi:hypothetical protein
MKAILEFDLDEPIDRSAHKRAVNADDVYIALHNINEELRAHAKYGVLINEGVQVALPEDYHTITEKESALLYNFIHHIRGSIRNIIEKQGINLDDLE